VNVSDDELVRRTLGGETEAFDLLIQRHTATLYRIVRRMCSDRAEAEAITQEAFLRAWENLPKSGRDRPFRPWLIRIAINVARDAWKKSRPLDFADLPTEEPLQITSTQPGPEEWVEESERLEELALAVQSLDPAYRMVIAMRYEADMTYEEMAAALKLPLNTVRTRLYRAKQELRQAMEARP
jgi:RNA polymerase sigma-70 factor (ECF subfamily)